MPEKIFIYIDDEKIEAKDELLIEVIERQKQAEQETQALKIKQQAAIEARNAVLTKLGLTADEAAVLLG